MQLSSIYIINDRSIKGLYKLDLSNMTVLLGKNNEGKTNIIKAISPVMENFLSEESYDFACELPIIKNYEKEAP